MAYVPQLVQTLGTKLRNMGCFLHNLTRHGNRWKFRKVIPARLRPYIDGKITEFIRHLGQGSIGDQPTPEVLQRFADASRECDRLFAQAEKRASGQLDKLPPELIAEVIATARHELLDEDDDVRFDADVIDHELHWWKRRVTLEANKASMADEYKQGRITDFIRDEVDERLMARGLVVDTTSEDYRRLCRAFLSLMIEVNEATLLRLDGKLVPTPPLPPQANYVTSSANRQVEHRVQTITGLADDWWKEAEKAGRSQSTREAYTRVARQFSEFLGHDNALAVTNRDVVAFKDHRLAQGTSLKTIKAGDLAGLNVLFKWGVDNLRVTTNPAAGVKVVVPRRTVTRPKGFTDAEAQTLLRAALDYRASPRESAKVVAQKRWVPWLLAYTGARVGEIVQLRKEDVRQHGDHWVMRITPEAFTVKTGDVREVVLHEHLVELGFIEFVNQAEPGHLFLVARSSDPTDLRGAWQTAKNNVTEFVRTVITDKNVQPNHAWRHRFETTARDLGKREDVTNTVTGHAVPGVARLYGDTSLKAMVEFFRDWPRYVL